MDSERKERPILFTGPLVRAILEGRKTQTRRLVKATGGRVRIPGTRRALVLGEQGLMWRPHGGAELQPYPRPEEASPYGVPGDRLWVREAHYIYPSPAPCWTGLPMRRGEHKGQPAIAYYREGFDRAFSGRWRPSIHMPRWASRIDLRVTSVRVERLQDISEEDARAEGVDMSHRLVALDSGQEYGPGEGAALRFRLLWDSINAKRAPWESNPWVWVVSFEREARHG